MIEQIVDTDIITIPAVPLRNRSKKNAERIVHSLSPHTLPEHQFQQHTAPARSREPVALGASSRRGKKTRRIELKQAAPRER